MADIDLIHIQERFEQLKKRLMPYWDLKINELPEELRKEVHSLPLLPSFTSGGLESVQTVRRMLGFAQAVINAVLQEKDSPPHLDELKS